MSLAISAKIKPEIDNYIGRVFTNAKTKIKLNKRLDLCKNSKIADLIVCDNGDTFVACQNSCLIIPVRSKSNSIAGRFLKGLDIANAINNAPSYNRFKDIFKR